MIQISIIVPIFNAEKTLLNIANCLNIQTFQNFEVLLVDDGSTDGSQALCNQIAAKDPRFRYIHQKNAGVSAARNRGLQEVKGEFITFLDADDVVDPNYLQALYETCTSLNSDISVCDVVVEEAGIETRRFTLPCRTLSHTEALNELLTRRNLNSGPYAKLFRRSVVENLHFPPLKAYEDILFVQNAFTNAQKIASTNLTAYHYIQNPHGAMSGFLRTPSLDIVTATSELLAFISSRKDLSADCFYITASHLMQYVIPMLPKPSEHEIPFIRAAQKLYGKHAMGILLCRAFPWKEKIIYLAFILGFIRKNKSFTRLEGI